VTLLANQGHWLLEAADGTRGLAAVQTERPDLVITDVLMPVMDGFEFVRQLRQRQETASIPVVFYTAHYAEREARKFALSCGVADVITKPASSAEVLKIVNRVLGGDAAGVLSEPAPLTTEFDREHLRLLTDKASETATDLRTAVARLKALINIGLEFASERDEGRRLETVCASARELFGATYVTLGILDAHDGDKVERVITCGTEAAGWIKPGDDVQGILATALAERRTVRGENPGGDPLTLQLPPLHPEIRAFLVTPIASPGHVFGWICLVINEGPTFVEDDEDLALALSGQVGRIYELEREIIERKHAELAVRHERDRAQQYLDTAEVILLALDLDGRITLVNRHGCVLLGRTFDALLGRDWAEACLPDRARDGFKRQFHDMVAGRLPATESPILASSGDERVIEWCNTLLCDPDGRVIGTFSSGTDVTERNRAVRSLRRAEERMRFALEAAGVGIWDMDFATGQLEWSEILQSQHGLQSGSFEGTFAAFVEKVHPGDRDALLGIMAEANQSGADFSVLYRTIWPDGTIRWLSGSGRVHLGAHGEPLRGVGISIDVTERTILEEQHQQSQRMEAIGRLAAGVAHDFNNLLTVILGYCELLQEDLEPGDQRKADMAEIQKAGRSAAWLTRQLLAFSRKQIIEPTLLDLSAVLTDMRTMIGRLIGEDVTIAVALEPDPALVRADRGQVEQIVLNLAVNARDAMPKGGTLTIATTRVELDEQYAKTHLAVQPGHYVVLTVTDTGTGMTPEVKARLFEPFFTTKDVDKGTGLGLATVQAIVSRNGGSIEVHTDLGRGTSFEIYLPEAGAVDADGHTPPPPRLRRAGSETVLIVEDSEGLRELARRLLQRQGYRVLIAANADEAFRLFEQDGAVDVLLTDVVMPGASGPELTRQLIERRPALKVIYMSGYTDAAIVEHGGLASGIALLHKPFTSEAVGQKIREVLEQ
jgi:PAS domain S-box-containing protein